MKHLNAILFIVLLAYPATILNAQDKVAFTGTAPQVVEVGEYFRLTYTLNQKGDGFTGPKMTDFTYSGPMISTNMSTQIINGKVSQSTTYTYTYTIQAAKEGEYTIPPAKVTVSGKSYTSNQLKIEVVKGNPARNQQPSRSRTQSANQSQTIADTDLFVRINLDKQSAYKGEQVLATIKVYTRVNLSRFGDIKIPSYKGFWSQEIKIPDQISLVRENFNGQIYNVGTIKKSILVPQQVGEIKIEPFELECYVNVQSARSRSVFDDFFGSHETVKKQLISPEVSIQVKALPPGAPPTFNGAVGQFRLISEINKTNLQTNEALDLKVTIAGNGNFMLIDAPKIKFPPDFEVYDPKQADNYRTTEQGISGEKSFVFLAIPRFGGSFDIPSIGFSYFDPNSSEYKTLNTQSYTVDVAQSTQEETGAIITRSSGNEIRMLGQDIRFIKTGAIHLYNSKDLLTKQTWFYWLYLIIALSTTLLIIFFLNRQKKRSDVAATRSKQAVRTGQKRIKKAREALKNDQKELFLDEILKAIWGYLGDKFSIDPSGYRRELIEESFAKQQINPELLTRVFELLDRCEYIRYAPGGQNEELDHMLTSTGKLINDMELILGKKKKNDA